MSISEKLTAVAENIPLVYAAGRNASPLRYAANPNGLFWGAVFPEGYEAVADLSCGGGGQNLYEMFRAAKGLRKVTLQIPVTKACNARHFLYLCAAVQELSLPEGIKFSNFESFVSGCSKLHTIYGAIDLTESTSNKEAFFGCTELMQVRFQPETIRLSIGFSKSQKLSAESVESILAGLAPVETAQVLQLHETVRQNLTQVQLQTLAGKNWTVE